MIENGWSVEIQSTSDPSVYRGVYKKDGKTLYEVEGYGITNALRNLADEIDEL